MHLVYFDVSAQEINDNDKNEKKINLNVCTSGISLKFLSHFTNTKKVCLIMPKVMSGEFTFLLIA